MDTSSERKEKPAQPRASHDLSSSQAFLTPFWAQLGFRDALKLFRGGVGSRAYLQQNTHTHRDICQPSFYDVAAFRGNLGHGHNTCPTTMSGGGHCHMAHTALVCVALHSFVRGFGVATGGKESQRLGKPEAGKGDF